MPWCIRQSPPPPCPGPEDRVTCEVLSFEVQVVEFVNVAYVHLFLVQLGLVEVLEKRKHKCGSFLNGQACSIFH